MQYDILVTPINGHFRGRVIGLAEIVIEAPTRQAVITQIEHEIRQLLAESEIVKLDLDAHSRPPSLAQFAGMWQDDPLFEQFVDAMQRYRAEVDTDPNQP